MFHTDAAADTTLPEDPDLQLQYRDCLQQLKTFLITDTLVTVPPATPVTCSTRHKPWSDTGLDLIGHSFSDKSLGDCLIVGTDTWLDEDGILWHLLQYTQSRKPKADPLVSKVSEVRAWLKRKGSKPPPPYPAPPRQKQ